MRLVEPQPAKTWGLTRVSVSTKPHNGSARASHCEKPHKKKPDPRRRLRDPRASRIRKQRLIKRCGKQCAYCSKSLSFQQMTVDHVLCVRDRGSEWIGNLLPACSRCNHQRGTKDLEQWVQECVSRGLNINQSLVERALEHQRDPLVLHVNYVLHLRQVAAWRSWRAGAEIVFANKI